MVLYLKLETTILATSSVGTTLSSKIWLGFKYIACINKILLYLIILIVYYSKMYIISNLFNMLKFSGFFYFQTCVSLCVFSIPLSIGCYCCYFGFLFSLWWVNIYFILLAWLLKMLELIYYWKKKTQNIFHFLTLEIFWYFYF